MLYKLHLVNNNQYFNKEYNKTIKYNIGSRSISWTQLVQLNFYNYNNHLYLTSQ